MTDGTILVLFGATIQVIPQMRAIAALARRRRSARLRPAISG